MAKLPEWLERELERRILHEEAERMCRDEDTDLMPYYSPLSDLPLRIDYVKQQPVNERNGGVAHSVFMVGLGVKKKNNEIYFSTSQDITMISGADIATQARGLASVMDQDPSFRVKFVRYPPRTPKYTVETDFENMTPEQKKALYESFGR